MGINVLKKLVLTTAVVLSFSASANAANVNLGYGATNLTVAVNRDPNVSGPFSFTDIYNLNVSSLTSFSAIATEVELNFSVLNGGVPQNFAIYNIVNSSFSYGLYNAANSLVTNTSALLPGLYQYRVSGTIDGISGGQYSLGLNIASVSAVPEPELGFTMVLGLAMIGLVSLRKAKSA